MNTKQIRETKKGSNASASLPIIVVAAAGLNRQPPQHQGKLFKHHAQN